MAHSKKSRKIGSIGVAKADREKAKTPKKNRNSPQSLPKAKKGSGNKAGTRQNASTDKAQESNSNSKQDPRLGSTKAINLDKYKNKNDAKAPTKKTPAKKKYFSPQQELDAIEQDGRLEHLLEKQENNKLSVDEQAYLDATLARHRQLCDLLGISLESDSEKEQSSDELDPFEQLDAIKLDDFKDE